MNPAFFRFELDLSVKDLQDDLKVCEDAEWKSHYNRQDYAGSWTSISLRSGSGKTDDIRAFPYETYADTPLLDKCPYFRWAIAWFECDKEAIRLLRLDPFSKIKEHNDRGACYEEGDFRIHIPIITNEQVIFRVNKHLVPMKEGECWYANFDLPHSVENNSDTPRVHLVIDCKRNEWSDGIFERAGFELSAIPDRRRMDNKTKRLVIDQLLRNPTETNVKLAAALREEVNASGGADH